MKPLSDNELKKLRADNLRLKAELETLKAGMKASTRLKGWFARHVSNLLMGKGLKKSFLRLYNELPGNVTKDSLADVSSHLVWRMTRIGTLAIFATLIPLMILLVQTIILNAQNDKLDQQNVLIQNQNYRLDQQIQLDESTRRSSFIFLMSNIMDKVDEELKNPSNITRTLTDELIGRIVSLSQSLRPYRYLENNELTPQPLSPERGQLLFALINSWLDEETYDKIFEKANFNYADLRDANFSHAYLRNAKLAYSNFPNAIFDKTNLEFADFSNANLERGHFENTFMPGIKLVNASLESADLYFVVANNAQMEGVDIRNASFSGDFSEISLAGVQFEGASLGSVELEGAFFQSPTSLDSLESWGLEGGQKLKENYLIETDSNFSETGVAEVIFVLKKRLDAPLSIMENCKNAVVQIIQSSSRIRRISSQLETRGDRIMFSQIANPFGNADELIQKDSVYIFRVSSEQSETFTSLFWVHYDPVHEKCLKLTWKIQPPYYYR